ncbi:hypothetical protein AB205_0187810 [Aquarana catesbeiana]|uniref:G-protein coupled receptors family 1 profile domain-containing protein n=1 Tax=Aquarana catesbeiana TaxID=8400 RepID=A0A2G9RTW5_AQUCT|nr:hypothetical protein AB205_0187810 [Aquarana catesbeiana]
MFFTREMFNMDEKNMTRITTIHLLGFQMPQRIKYWIFIIFLLIYCVSVCGNILIIILVSYSKTLHSPMYFFLSQLSASDLLLITDILPNMLHDILMKEARISFSDCFCQLYFFAVASTLECLLLTVMSYDRYLAILPNRGQSWNMAKFMSLLYTIVTPLMNPIIYSLRNKDFKQALGKLISFSYSLAQQ